MTDSARTVLIVLDVDGTISPIHPPDDLASRYTMHSYLPVDEQLIDGLDVLTRRADTTVAWLTSWSRDSVEWLWAQLGGRLSGTYIPHAQNWTSRPAGWRARSLLQYMATVKPHALIWADDDAGNDINGRRLDRAGYRYRHLLFGPDPDIGLTLDDVDMMREFIEELSDVRQV